MTLEERADDMIRQCRRDPDSSDGAIIRVLMLALVREDRRLIADYLDGYAGGHYMAQSCAAAIRNMEQGQ